MTLTTDFLTMLYIWSNIISALFAVWFVITKYVKTSSFEIAAYFVFFIAALSNVERAIHVYSFIHPSQALFTACVAIIFVIRFLHIKFGKG